MTTHQRSFAIADALRAGKSMADIVRTTGADRREIYRVSGKCGLPVTLADGTVVSSSSAKQRVQSERATQYARHGKYRGERDMMEGVT